MFLTTVWLLILSPQIGPASNIMIPNLPSEAECRELASKIIVETRDHFKACIPYKVQIK